MGIVDFLLFEPAAQFSGALGRFCKRLLEGTRGGIARQALAQLLGGTHRLGRARHALEAELFLLLDCVGDRIGHDHPIVPEAHTAAAQQ
jgi:hypothetical protein